MKIVPTLALALMLAGCSSTELIPNKAPDAQKATWQEKIKVRVEVTPRIGLFYKESDQSTDHFITTYIAAFNSEAKKKGGVRFSSSAERLEQLPSFTPLFTNTAKEAEKPRTVTITVTLPPNAADAFDCEISFDRQVTDRKPRNKVRSCPDYPVIAKIDNNAYVATVKIKPKGDTSGNNDRTFQVKIPPDFLIVSLGDSYASGEGNPDVEINRASPSSSSAIWMDERCHRSIWAGPIQAGLKLAAEEKNGEADPPDGVEVTVRGAVTVANFACSGATIYRGIIGPYEGIVPIREVRKLSHPVIDPDFFDKLHETSQLEQLKKFRGERQIDALTLSIGGNDVYFAPLLKAILSCDINSKNTDCSGKAASNSTQDRMKNIFEELLTSVGYSDIAETHLTKTKYRQILITDYPNSTYRCDTDEKECYCTGTLSHYELAKAVETLVSGQITKDEVKFIRPYILLKLNTVIEDAAKDYHWRLVKMDSNTSSFRKHGWCLPTTDASKTDGGTWFRDPVESQQLQNDNYGAMHPTQAGHRYYGDQIYSAISDGIHKELKIFIDNSVEVGKKTFYKPPLRLCFSSEEKRVSPIALEPQGTAQSDIGCSGYDHPKSPLTISARHPDTMVLFTKKFEGLTSDTAPPTIEISILADNPEGCKTETRCWSKEAQFRIRVNDDESGIASTSWQLDNNSGDTSDSEKIKDSYLQQNVQIPPGRHNLKVIASDRVGWQTTYEQSLGSDPSPPRLTAILAYGYRFTPSADELIAIPIVPDKKVELQLDAEDTGLDDTKSGLAQLLWEIQEKSGALQVNTQHGDAPNTFTGPLSLPTSADTLGFLPIKIRVQDVAGNLSEAVHVLGIPVRSGELGHLGSVAAWQNDDGRKQAMDLLQAIVAMSGNFSSTPVDTDETWPLFAAWLNLADGRFKPDKPVNTAISDCTIKSDTNNTAFALLKEASKCVAADRRDILLQLPAALQSNELLQ